MFLGLREHVVRSNPWYHGGKTPFDPNIMILAQIPNNIVGCKIPFKQNTHFKSQFNIFDFLLILTNISFKIN